MKNFNISTLFIFLFFLISFTSCEIIGDIFKAGLWVGIILVVLVIAVVIWLIKKFF